MSRRLPATVAIGVAFGSCLHRIGFASWDEVHRMFTFASLRLTLAFGAAVVLLAGGWAAIRRLQRPRWPSRLVHPGTLPGGLLFGAGWAICGACPSIALVQLGAGQVLAAVTLAGIVIGNLAYAWAHPRYFRWSTRGCLDD